ncbi:MAG: hypothetical protein ACHQDC_06455, partial [Acidimicrobiales bacterium]
MTAVRSAEGVTRPGALRRSAAADAPAQRAEGTVLRLIPTRSRRWVITAVMVVGLFGILGAAVTIQAQGIGDQERYDAVKSDIDRALDRQRDLRVSVAEAESPSYVLERARELGMIEPGPSLAVPAGATDPPTPPPAPTTTTIPKAAAQKTSPTSVPQTSSSATSGQKATTGQK